ncbi:hypothetical protein B0H13DRAFT_2379898 [Mycena leptocephala]|nr:hypothetical protein B0H13DRAFT_2379898 [Mycena leptocephala]
MPTTLQELEIVRRKTVLLKKINRFWKLQRMYMPDLVRYMMAGQQEIWNDKTHRAEAIKLFMPSELGTEARYQACEKGLAGIEEEMQEGELKETLKDLCQALRTRTMTHRFHIRNTSGQCALTQGQGVLWQITIWIHKAKLCYGYARNALLRLRGHGNWERVYQVLEEADVQGVNEQVVGEEELAEWDWLQELGQIVEGGITVAGVVAGGEADLIEALHVEWCKVYARTCHWHEDIMLICEEMRRTIEFGAWTAAEWEIRASARTAGVSPELAEGLCMYAKEHVHVDHEEATCLQLTKRWAGLCEKARQYLARVRCQA